jgi:ribosomal protein S18 acetylase RimI-like enzyme
MTGATHFDIILRTPRAGDTDGVRRVMKETWFATYQDIFGPEQAADQYQRHYSDQAIAYAIGYAPPGFVVAEQAGEIVGVVIGACGTFGRIFVYALYVRPDWQGQGIGAALLDRMWEIFPTGASIKLEVLEKNTVGIRFYERVGFHRLRRVSNAHGSDQPALLMCKLATPRMASWWFPLAVRRRTIAALLTRTR